MNAGPDAFRPHEPPLGAVPAGDADFGPISPELALVDRDLALRARELLPVPRERPRGQQPLRESPTPEPAARLVVRRRRRWPRTLVLAIVIFAAGAVSGSLLGNHETSAPATTLEVRAAAPTAHQSTTTRTVLRPPHQATATRAVLRPPHQSSATRAVLRPPKDARSRATTSPRRGQRRRHARVAWAGNVLGVEVTVGRNGVALVWQRPADSARVVVLRTRGSRASVVVYRGRAPSYRDASPRPCTGYRYTIVNYDRRGHRSTGVPTSVVTRCA